MKLSLDPELMALRNKSESELKQYFEELYSHVVLEHIETLLSDNSNRMNLEIVRVVIRSLFKNCIHTDSEGSSQWSLTPEERESLSVQLSQQCAPLYCDSSFWIEEMLKLLVSQRPSNYSDIYWSVAVPAVRVENLRDSMPLFAALFEHAEFVRNARAHLFIVPLLVGSASQIDAITHPFREFCVLLKDGQLEFGSIAGSLIRVHADKSSELAEQCLTKFQQTLTLMYAN